MRKLAVFFILFAAVLAAGCVGQPKTTENNTSVTINATVPPQDLGGFCGTSTHAACSADSDCAAGGCSNHVCYGKNEPPSATTCEWRECYDAEKYNVTCGCVAQKCAWAK